MVIRICVGLNFQLPVNQCLLEKTGLKSLKRDDRLHTFHTILHLENTNIKSFFLADDVYRRKRSERQYEARIGKNEF